MSTPLLKRHIAFQILLIISFLVKYLLQRQGENFFIVSLFYLKFRNGIKVFFTTRRKVKFKLKV